MKPSLLFLSRWYPYPPDNGSKKRILALLNQLSKKFDLYLISFFEGKPPSEDQQSYLENVCKQVVALPYPSRSQIGFRSLAGWFSRFPRMVIERDSAEFHRLVHDWFSSRKFDIVLASQIDMAPYAIKVTGIPRILEELEVSVIYESYLREKNPIFRLRRWATVDKLQSYLEWLLPQYSGITTTSVEESTQIRKLVPDVRSIWIVPNGVELEYKDQEPVKPNPRKITYTGAVTYSANFDAVQYFLSSIFPLVADKYADMKFLVTGANEGVDISSLSKISGVTFTGYLPDVRPAILESWVTVVPLRIGGGTRLKILESMALGTPVISTTKGAQGLNLVPERDILIADDPKEFSRQIIRIIESPTLREVLRINGRKTVEERFGWDQIGLQLAEHLMDILPAREEN